MAGNRIKFIEMQTIDSSTIDDTAWYPIGNPIEGALTYINIVNNSSTDISISFDNSTYNLFLKAGNFFPIYFQLSALPNSYIAKLKKNTIVYVRGTTGLGNIYLSGTYNE